jgi:SAM-dependent methyltransferase
VVEAQEDEPLNKIEFQPMHPTPPVSLSQEAVSARPAEPRKSWLKQSLKRVLPASVAGWLSRLKRKGQVRFGSLRRVKPIARNFGMGRGYIIDRYYIEGFLERHGADIRGRVLEIGSNDYTLRFGTQVTRSDVLHVQAGNPQATIVADLTREEDFPANTFDCLILTQTLQFIYDVRAAIRTAYKILRPGGVLLATVPGISQIARGDFNRWGEHWRFTSMSAARLFEEVFPAGCVEAEAHGNVLAAVGFLHGLVVEDVGSEKLDYHDPDYEVTITIRATKPLAADGTDADGGPRPDAVY